MAGGHRVLVINPGSTSTQLACFLDEERLAGEREEHSVDELAPFDSVLDQEEFRFRLVKRFVGKCCGGGLDAVAGRGGLLCPLPSGVYGVGEAMLDDLRKARFGEHASNLGAILAHRVADAHGVPAFIADPPVVDEMETGSRITGLPLVKRHSVFHALNQKEVGRRFARSSGRAYGELDLIIAHLGGGISVGVHRKGRVVWVNDALGGDGPFSPERVGSLPALRVLDLAFSGEYTERDLRRMMQGGGGLVAHLGTNDIRRALALDTPEVELLMGAMALQITREITAGFGVLARLPDAVIITGNLAKSEKLTGLVAARVESLAKVVVMPGSFEMEALAAAVVRVLEGREEAMAYPPSGCDGPAA